jgi:hypothetical protein
MEDLSCPVLSAKWVSANCHASMGGLSCWVSSVECWVSFCQLPCFYGWIKLLSVRCWVRGSAYLLTWQPEGSFGSWRSRGSVVPRGALWAWEPHEDGPSFLAAPSLQATLSARWLHAYCRARFFLPLFSSHDIVKLPRIHYSWNIT